MCEWKCSDELMIFITHTCNLTKLHPNCDQRIAHSNYSMDLESFEKILSICSNRHWSKFEFFGGEAFLNPLFGQFVFLGREKLDVHQLAVTTNGCFHAKFSDEVFLKLDHISITHYTGINDKEVFSLKERLEYLGIDFTIIRNDHKVCDAIGIDYGLSEFEISRLAQKCQRRWPSIYSDKIFPCCIGEAIQKTNIDIEPSWISFSEDWFDKIHRPDYPVCQRCWHILELLGLPTHKPT